MAHAVGNGSVIRRDRKLDGTLKDRKRCRVWDLSVTMDDGTHPSERFEGTEREAMARLPQWIAELEVDETETPPTFAQYAAEWHERRTRSGDYAAYTLQMEAGKLRALNRHIGHVRLDELTPRAIEDAYAALRNGDTASGRPWAASTLQQAHITLSTVLKDALRRDVIASNPLSSVDCPRRARSTRKALTDEQMASLVSSLDPTERHERALLLCVCCGLRRGETCAALWRDLSDGVLHVHRTVGGDGRTKAPKTSSGDRLVPVPAFLADALEELRGGPDEPICSTRGISPGPTCLDLWWAKRRGDFGVDCTIHELRHSYLTRLARAGVHPRVMMELAGHASTRVTMEVYTHVDMEMKGGAVDAAFGKFS